MKFKNYDLALESSKHFEKARNEKVSQNIIENRDSAFVTDLYSALKIYQFSEE
jgi:hypothetical protein